MEELKLIELKDNIKDIKVQFRELEFKHRELIYYTHNLEKKFNVLTLENNDIIKEKRKMNLEIQHYKHILKCLDKLIKEGIK